MKPEIIRLKAENDQLRAKNVDHQANKHIFTEPDFYGTKHHRN